MNIIKTEVIPNVNTLMPPMPTVVNYSIKDKLSFSQNLEARLLNLSKKVNSFCKLIPKDRINIEYSDQLNRSTCSIGANYIEANEAESRKDFFHRIKISRKESKEAKYWLEIITYSLPNFQTDAQTLLLKELDELLRLFSSILKKNV